MERNGFFAVFFQKKMWRIDAVDKNIAPGLKTGDVLISLNGEDLKGKSISIVETIMAKKLLDYTVISHGESIILFMWLYKH